MLREVFLFSIFLSLPTLARAADVSDLCAIRPDLCDDSAPATKLKKKPARPTVAPSLGQTQRSSATDDLFDDPAPVLKPTAAATRSPASVAKPVKVATLGTIRGISYEDYLAKNALNPALGTKIANHQDAFADRTVILSDSIPSNGLPTDSSVAPGGGSIIVPTSQGNVVVPMGNGGGGGGGQGGDGFSSIPGS